MYISITFRKSWVPTKAQALLLDMMRQSAGKMTSGEILDE
jgi:hypothetical protein